MRTDILDLHHFYETPLGELVRQTIGEALAELCNDIQGQRIAGFGYTTPWLGKFEDARTVIALAPDAQGVMRWPLTDTDNSKNDHTNNLTTDFYSNKACLVHEGYWPLPDRSMDKIIIIHGLEEVRDATRLLREAWRVLADDGQLIIVAAQRRGLWAAYDTTPMAAGRPWLRGQLNRLLEGALFTPSKVIRALHFPPLQLRLIHKSAKAWENIGKRLWPGFCGVLIIEAQKSLLNPVTGTPQRVLNVIRPKLAGALMPGTKPFRARSKKA